LAADRSARFARMEDFADAIMACLRTIAPAAADEVTDYSGEISGPRAAAPGRLARVARRYVPWFALIAASALLATVLALRGDDATPAPARPAPPEPSTLIAPPPPPPPSVPAPPPVIAVPDPAPVEAPEITIDAGAPAPKLERSPPRVAPRRRAPNAVELGVSEW
jgi:outer membrane biosynthesis protein TonB